MKIILPSEIKERLIAELTKAKRVEIGGILMGEHIAEDEFKVCDLTVQRIKGGFAFFERLLQGMIEPLKRFFRKTNQNYGKFNYLGEWHSHPSFLLLPSVVDNATMSAIAEDEELGANFVVLLIVKLTSIDELKGTVTFYFPDGRCNQGELILC